LQIIVIPDRLARARTLSISMRHMVASLMLALLLLLGMTAGELDERLAGGRALGMIEASL